MKICEKSEFEKIHREGKKNKEKVMGRLLCLLALTNLPFLLLVRSLVDSLRVSFWPTFSNQKAVFLLLDPLPLALAWDMGI